MENIKYFIIFYLTLIGYFFNRIYLKKILHSLQYYTFFFSEKLSHF